MVRMRTRFAPFGSGDVSATQLPFTDPVVLLRVPFRVSFSYSSGDGSWQDTWRQSSQLPAAVRFLVRDTTTGRTLAISSATMVHVNLQAGCGDVPSSGAPSSGPSASSGGAPVPPGGASGAAAAPGATAAPGSLASSGCGNAPGAPPPAAGASPSTPAQGQ
jgi:hypothetical protein